MKVDQAEYDNTMADNDATNGIILTLQKDSNSIKHHFILDDSPLDDVTLLIRGLLNTMKANNIITEDQYQKARLQYRRSP